MTQVVVSSKRAQSLGEEIANSVSHGVGLLAAMVAAPVLIVGAVQRGEVTGVIGASVFSFTVGLLYLASVLYHTLPPSRAKRVFRVLDHSAIFLLIAGTYTPFMLGVLHGAWGWSLLVLVWSLALGGVAFKVIFGVRYLRFSVGLYLAMGWVVHSGQAALASHARGGTLLAPLGRYRIHGGSSLLRSPSRPVQPLRLALVRPHRHGVPFHRSAALRGLTNNGTCQQL